MSVNNEFNLGVSEKISDSISNSSIGLNSQVSALDSGSVNKPLFDAETLAANVIEKKKEDKKQAEKKDIEKKNTNTSMSEKNKNQDSGTISSIIESLTSFLAVEIMIKNAWLNLSSRLNNRIQNCRFWMAVLMLLNLKRLPIQLFPILIS